MDQQLIQNDLIDVESVFVRHRNCLLLRAEFSPVFTDYYLHLMQHGIRHDETLDFDLKKVLAYFILHLVSRPWAEYHAWTLNLRRPMIANIFVSGSSLTESAVARAFTEDVRVPEENMLYAQMIRDGKQPQTSVIILHGDTPENWVEDYYAQSEQRPARCFDLGNDSFCLLAAQPDADLEWLRTATADTVRQLEEAEETRTLETRRFRFHCGCSVEKIMPAIQAMKGDLADLLSENGHIEVTCPRCAAEYRITTDMLNPPDSPAAT